MSRLAAVRRVCLLALALALLAAGCGGGEVVAPTAETFEGTTEQAAKGDAAAGKSLFSAQGCNACHTFTPAGSKAAIGPNLDQLAEHAEEAGQGSVEEYATASIKNPNAYVTPGFPQGVMPAYDSLSEQQVADLVAFITQPS